MNDVVRERAASDGVWLVDVDGLIQERLPAGVSSFELFADNCHPSPEGGYLIAGAILDGLEGSGVSGQKPAGVAAPTVEEVLARLGFTAESPLRLEYLARRA